MRYTMTVNSETSALMFTLEIEREDIEAIALSDDDLSAFDPIVLSKDVGSRVLAMAELVRRIETGATEKQSQRNWDWSFPNVAGAVDGVASAAGQIWTSTAQVAEESVRAVRRMQLPNFGGGMDQVTTWFNSALGSADFSAHLDRWMRATFATGRATVYDRAMDAEYIETHVGGGYHRLFDGGHDLLGAWGAIRDATPDDSGLEQIHGYFHALWKDFVTPMGLPFATLDKESFDAVSEVLSDNLGISKVWLADAASLTATELLGSVIGVVSVSLNWSNADVRRFSSLVGSLGLSSLASGNPLVTIVAIVALARAYQQAAHGDEYGRLAAGLTKGVVTCGFGTGVSLAVASIAPPAWIGVIVIICVGALTHRAYDKGEQVLRDVDWVELASSAQNYLARAIPPAGWTEQLLPNTPPFLSHGAVEIEAAWQAVRSVVKPSCG